MPIRLDGIPLRKFAVVVEVAVFIVVSALELTESPSKTGTPT